MSDLNRIVGIYRSISNCHHEGTVTEGQLLVENESLRLFLLTTEQGNRADELGLTILSDPEDVTVGSEIRIRLYPSKSLPVYRSLSVFLSNGARLLEPVEELYIVDDDYFSGDQQPPDLFQNLSALCSVIAQLKDAAAVVNKDKAHLVFADNVGLVELPISSSPDELNKVTAAIADEFAEFCSDELHRKHRLEAVANVIIRRLRGQPVSQRFHYVICNLSSILSDAKSQHAVFMLHP